MQPFLIAASLVFALALITYVWLLLDDGPKVVAGSESTIRITAAWVMAAASLLILVRTQFMLPNANLTSTRVASGIGVALLVANAVAESARWYSGSREAAAAFAVGMGGAITGLMIVRARLWADHLPHARNMNAYVNALSSPPGAPLTADEAGRVRDHASKTFAGSRGLSDGTERRVRRMVERGQQRLLR